MIATRIRKSIILVAEDDEDYRDYVCALLNSWEYEVISVCDGGAAMNVIDTALDDPMSARMPALLITDLEMPCCDGLKVLSYASFLPAIAITAFGNAATHARARHCGANVVFDKPLVVHTLRAAVGALVH